MKRDTPLKFGQKQNKPEGERNLQNDSVDQPTKSHFFYKYNKK